MSTFIVAFAAIFATKVAAFPSNYNADQAGCEIPTMGFAGHPEAATDPDVVIMLMDTAGAPADSFTAGEVYTVTTEAYTASAVNVWLHASIGELEAGTGMDVADCEEAVFTTGATADGLTTMWTAPADADECVVISVAQAAGSSDSYHTGTMEVCADDAAGAGDTDAVAADAEAEADDAADTADDAVDDAEDAADAAGEDAEDAADDADEALTGDGKDAAVGLGSVAAAAAGCAALVAAML